MNHLSRVLCAVHSDDRSQHVFAQALTLARAHDARLTLLHAASPDVAFNHRAAERTAYLHQLRALAEEAGVTTRVTVQRGYVPEIVLLHARTLQPDVVVIGAARRGQRRGWCGGMAEQVLHGASCPTLIVPEHADAPARLFERTVCAVDFQAASWTAARQAMRLAARTGGQTTLLHVVPGPSAQARLLYGWLPTHEYYRDLSQSARHTLQSLMNPAHGGDVAPLVIVGQPIEAILATARELDASLLVIGAGGRTRLGSRLFGKTGALLSDAPCSVLAIPESRAERTRAGVSDRARRAA